jgi:hypothetical protein
MHGALLYYSAKAVALQALESFPGFQRQMNSASHGDFDAVFFTIASMSIE